MSKAIAVIDKPKNCEVCPFGRCKYSLPLTTHGKGFYCQLREPKNRVVEDFHYDDEVHLQNCPLREVPQKKDEWIPTTIPDIEVCGRKKDKFVSGYNACIDEIMKGVEENG